MLPERVAKLGGSLMPIYETQFKMKAVGRILYLISAVVKRRYKSKLDKNDKKNWFNTKIQFCRQQVGNKALLLYPLSFVFVATYQEVERNVTEVVTYNS